MRPIAAACSFLFWRALYWAQPPQPRFYGCGPPVGAYVRRLVVSSISLLFYGAFPFTAFQETLLGLVPFQAQACVHCLYWEPPSTFMLTSYFLYVECPNVRRYPQQRVMYLAQPLLGPPVLFCSCLQCISVNERYSSSCHFVASNPIIPSHSPYYLIMKKQLPFFLFLLDQPLSFI